jgi:hypothetical protein
MFAGWELGPGSKVAGAGVDGKKERVPFVLFAIFPRKLGNFRPEELSQT